MKDKRTFKISLFFWICAIFVVGAATFYFDAADKKENTVTITFDGHSKNSTIYTTEADTTNTTSLTTKAATTAVYTTEAIVPTTEYLYIDINSADAAELIKLHGIGEVLANEIISYRENSGGFSNIEEIMNVKGIGEGIFSDIRDHIYVLYPVYDETHSDGEAETETVTEEETEPEYSPTLEDLAPIDINTAEAEILMLLPHVDEEIASRIIEFRNSAGFSHEYELLMIKGLSQQDVSEIIPYIKV